jgi:hypothetical protein
MVERGEQKAMFGGNVLSAVIGLSSNEREGGSVLK